MSGLYYERIPILHIIVVSCRRVYLYDGSIPSIISILEGGMAIDG